MLQLSLPHTRPRHSHYNNSSILSLSPTTTTIFFFFFFNDTATTEIYTLSLHDALPIWKMPHESKSSPREIQNYLGRVNFEFRSEEHTSELQSHVNLVCRLLLEKKKKNKK